MTCAMAQYKLTYFDFSRSRGEECRLALYVAGVEFEDHRLKDSDWPALKPNTPFGALPILESPGRPALAQSNAILVYVGRRYGLHPSDAWEAARHEAILASVEDLRAALAPSGKIKDPTEKKRAREELASGLIQQWAGQIERQIQGPFVGGQRLNVADIKLMQIVTMFKAGVLDHIPSDVLAPFPKLEAVYEAVGRHPKVIEWRARH